MTDEPTEPASVDDPVVQMKELMTSEIAKLKEEFSGIIAEKDSKIQELTEQNIGLQRAIVRGATSEVKAEPSEEERYKMAVKKLADKTLTLM